MHAHSRSATVPTSNGCRAVTAWPERSRTASSEEQRERIGDQARVQHLLDRVRRAGLATFDPVGESGAGGRSSIEPMRRHVVLGVVLAGVAGVAVVGSTLSARQGASDVSAESSALVGGSSLQVSVPGAEGGKTVIGQLTVARAVDAGFVTAYPCADGVPVDASGAINRSDLNYEGRTSPVWSNRLIVEADDAGNVCLRSSTEVEFVVDINAVSFDTGITSFENWRTDTRIDGSPIEAGKELRIEVPAAVGGKTVIGQLTGARATGRGFVTAYPCADGMPVDDTGEPTRSDLNFDAASSTVSSNRMIVEADESGAICLRPSERLHLVVDLNGVADAGIESLVNQRTDTRSSTKLDAGDVLRVSVPEAADSKTVIGQLTAARASDLGFVTAYPCAAGVPVDVTGRIDRSDVNGNGLVGPVWSNRLIVEADDEGEVCFHTSSAVHLVVDVNGISDGGITSFANIRVDTRDDTQPPAAELPTDAAGTPVWPHYTPLPPLDGVAALTGLPAGPDVAARPIVATKIDNYRLARPHAALSVADVVFEVNTESVSRFVALFHTELPTRVGPVRSAARTTDVELLTAMNRPIFAFSGANPGVNRWLDSATESGVLVRARSTVERVLCPRRGSARPAQPLRGRSVHGRRSALGRRGPPVVGDRCRLAAGRGVANDR